MMLSPRARELLEIQRRKYQDSLPQKKAAIEVGWEALETGGWTDAQFGRFKTEIHRLAGSAGSYGLDELGAAAMELDRLLVSADRSRARLPEIGRLLNRLSGELAAVARNPR